MLTLNSFLALAQAAGLRVSLPCDHIDQDAVDMWGYYDPTYEVVAVSCSAWAYCYVRLVEGEVLVSEYFGQDFAEVKEALATVGIKPRVGVEGSPSYLELKEVGWMV